MLARGKGKWLGNVSHFPDAALTPSVAEILRSAHHLWRRHRPIAASRWGPPVLDATMDLSDQGLEHWRGALASLQTSVTTARREVFSPLDEAVLAELQRFIHEQMIQDAQEFQVRITPYLHLITHALLPFHLPPPQDLEMNIALQDRLGDCVDWLRQGQRRLEAGALGVAEGDRLMASHLAQSLAQWNNPYLGPGVVALREQLFQWAQIPPRPPKQPSPRINARWYLEAVLDIPHSIEQIQELCAERLRVEVNHLGRTLSTNATTITPPATLDGRDASEESALAWIDRIAADLRRHVEGVILDQVGPPARVCPVPDLLAPLVDDALYLPPTTTGGPSQGAGWFLFPRAFLESAVEPQRRAALMAIVAHEVCPGHGEQLRRAARSPLTLLYEITRSPIGLEGWAVWAEGAILQMQDVPPGAEIGVYAHRVRRLLAAVQVLTAVTEGREAAQTRTTKLLAPLPFLERQRLLAVHHRRGWVPVMYAVGLMETERALDKVAEKLGVHSADSTVAEAFLAWGPLAPSRITELITRNRLGAADTDADNNPSDSFQGTTMAAPAATSALSTRGNIGSA